MLSYSSLESALKLNFVPLVVPSPMISFFRQNSILSESHGLYKPGVLTEIEVIFRGPCLTGRCYRV